MSTLGFDDRSGEVRLGEYRPDSPEHRALLGDRTAREDSGQFDAGDGRDRFHEELRRRNLGILLWTNLIFNPTLLLWGVFDFFLAPDSWRYFVSLRLAGVAINTATMLVLLRSGLRRYSWEGMWLLIFTLCAVVALMLPLSGGSFARYVMGFAVIVFGAGVIPVWPPRWGLSVLVCSVAFAVLVLLTREGEGIAGGDILGNSFVVATAVGLSIAATFFKYDLMRSEFESRGKLAAVAQRESRTSRSLEEASQELQSALARLRELDRLKSKFFANISHELRTPLTMILGPLGELERWVSGDDGKAFVSVIRRNAERLLGLIDDLLDLSRLDAGGLRLNLAEIDIRSVGTTVFENTRPAALAKGIDSRFVADSSVQKIWGDAHRLEIVLTNLVSNAIKFTDRGGTIETRIQDEPDGVLVEVEDNGIGIPAENLPRVFERFFQVGAGDRRREGGVGIGLALAKELVELHGGSIKVESNENQFTRFSLKIPFGRDHIRPDVVERRRMIEAAPPRGRRTEDPETVLEVNLQPTVLETAMVDATDEEAYQFGGWRTANILLVEDHEEVRDFIRVLLAPRYNVQTAVSGREALGLVMDRPPDLVVSDVMMPEMSGTELCRAIKSDPRTSGIPVILLTARVGSEATLEAYAFGADDFVAKPFHPRVLMARIRAQLRLRDLGLRLAEREKLAVVGTLAAGILHEVRNPVNAILNASRLLSQEETAQSTKDELVQIIAEGANRIQRITEALDSHARPAEGGEPRPCDVSEGIQATLRLLQHRLNGIVVNQEYLTDRMALVSAGPINQVFLNLLDNSLRAGAGVLWIQVRESGDRIQIRFADDGAGVPSQNAERIFDPFYTTRSDGSGTGLGLYLSRKMVTDEGGSLWHEPRPGGGAVFVIEVPSEFEGLGDRSRTRRAQTV